VADECMPIQAQNFQKSYFYKAVFVKQLNDEYKTQ